MLVSLQVTSSSIGRSHTWQMRCKLGMVKDKWDPNPVLPHYICCLEVALPLTSHGSYQVMTPQIL